jgi:gliding motility-associated-like protein
VTTDQLTWQDGSNAPTMIADTEQTYSLQITNACGVATDELTLSIDNNVPVVLLDPEIVWCPGEFLILDVAQSFPAVYSWNTGAQTPSLTIVTEGTYAVTVTAPCAADSGNTDVHSIDDCFPKIDFYLPNVFSPDNSGINDIFRLEISEDVELTAVQGNIFDRWGSLVFSSTAIPFVWSGDFNGQLLNPGVYCYQIHATYELDGKTFTEFLVGDVTLIR